MAKKKEPTKESAEEAPPESILVKAAKTIGSVTGTVAAAVGITAPPKPKTPPKPRVPKLAKKGKTRLPRKAKKAAQKAQAKNESSVPVT